MSEIDPVLEKVYAIRKSEVAGYSRHLMIGGGTRGGPLLVRGKGCWVEDIDGKKYIDCTSQSWALYLGYANDAINAIVGQHMQNLSHVHQGFDTLPRFALAKKLAELAPRGLDRVSFTVGGGLAVEAAMKIALKNRPGAQEFLCLYDSYHGTTLGTMGASWQSTMAGGKLMAPAGYNRLTKQFIRVPNPYCFRCPLGLQRKSCSLMCLTVLKTMVQRGINGPVAGLIVEPLQASGGQVIFPKEYLEGVRAICDELGIVLIYDEIQTFARIGTFFAGEYYGVDPDIIVLGKGLGAGFPIGAIIIRDTLEGFSPETEELHTFANNSVSQVAALKLIDELERWALANCRTMGERIGKGLREIQKDSPVIGDVRQAGLHIGVELVRDPQNREPHPELVGAIRKKGLEKGIIFGLGGTARNVLKIKPPLIITAQETDAVLELFRESLAAAVAEQR
ncbi:MAG TPA: aminotransferase class III-fold pyridoxal phosphate-dependent enzyme [Spirochaetia bacterium]|nr:aminotransferase class III-fold pyridoxal phosphate-dependent enzyme [Spirochaetia bacterium]